MQAPLSPEQFSAVWSRVAPEGSGGILPVTPSEPEQSPRSQGTLSRCSFLICQAEQEDFLYRFLRHACQPNLDSRISEARQRIRTLSQQYASLTGDCYCPHHLLRLAWADQYPDDLCQLCRRLEQKYRSYAQTLRDSRLRDLFLTYARQVHELIPILTA